MPLDDETGEYPQSPGRNHRFTWPAKTLSAIFAVALVGSVGVVVKQHFDTTPTPTAAALTAPVILPAPPAAKKGPGKASGSGKTKASATPTKTASSTPPYTSWPLKFDPTFQGSQLDTHVWDTCYAYATGTSGCTNYGNTSDRELQWYMAAQDQVSGGELHLVAKHEPTPGHTQSGAPTEYSCRSGMVTSLPDFNFEYGYIQITAQIPFGTGLWPAFWLEASNQKWPPEIDILEHWHSENYGKVYLHPLNGKRQGGPVTEPGIGTGWHTFSLYWTPKRLVWYYDGNQVFATSTGIPHQDMYLIMNLADDQGGAGSCSGSLNIQSVKVWQQPG